MLCMHWHFIGLLKEVNVCNRRSKAAVFSFTRCRRSTVISRVTQQINGKAVCIHGRRLERYGSQQVVTATVNCSLY